MPNEKRPVAHDPFAFMPDPAGGVTFVSQKGAIEPQSELVPQGDPALEPVRHVPIVLLAAATEQKDPAEQPFAPGAVEQGPPLLPAWQV